MTNIILRPEWQGRDRDVTPSHVYHNRRHFIQRLGLGTLGLAATGVGLGCDEPRSSGAFAAARGEGPLSTIPARAPREGYPAPLNDRYVVSERGITDRVATASYNNYYEFNPEGKDVWPHTDAYEPFPHTLVFTGLVEKPFRIDVDQLLRRMTLEERVYRFRCVEAWATTVPWTGFPLRRMIEGARPLSSATHVRFVSRLERKQMPGVRRAHWYTWPYYEGLRMDEAMHELAFVAVGMYGEPLPKQNGSPLRLVLPWKYGYKGPKAVTRVEFVNKQPATFWNDLHPNEYGFLSNVNPNVPHPRWSQASERIIDTGDQVPTLLLNGYAEFVGDLYPEEPTSLSRVVR